MFERDFYRGPDLGGLIAGYGPGWSDFIHFMNCLVYFKSNFWQIHNDSH